jgi:hypothetical protein
VAVAIYGPEAADALAAQWLVDAKRATAVHPRRLAARPLLGRFAESSARLFATVL